MLYKGVDAAAALVFLKKPVGVVAYVGAGKAFPDRMARHDDEVGEFHFPVAG